MNSFPLKTQCVGHLSVDMPTAASIQWTQQFDGADATRMTGVISKDQFWKRVVARRDELRALPHETEKTQLGMYEVIGERAAVLLYRDSDVWTGGFSMERFLWLSTRGYRLTSPATDNETARQIARRIEVFNHLVEHDGSSGKPGFCIDGARLTGSLDDVEVHATQANLAPVGLINGSLIVSNSRSEMPLPSTAQKPITPFESLRSEQDSIRVSAAQFPMGIGEPDFTKTFDVLRKRERKVSGMVGQEIAFKEVLNNGKARYKLRWTSTYPAEAQPHISSALLLTVGNDDDAADPNLDERAMFALWDAVLESMLVR